ncbi:hypothetical protein F4802DRAFT_369340 [Xylaria palmicola]|nr:hypothetical protein F4802DRAFT_369340 [Xylaria palmicola]
MSLLRLPPEMLAQIFDKLGSAFFREDLGRLTVCKLWLEFALPAFFNDVILSQEKLRCLITSGVMKKPSPLNRSLATLNIELGGYQHPCSSTSDPQENAQESNASNSISSNESLEDISITTWINDLNDDLAQLATIAQQSRRLRTLYIRARSAPSPDLLHDPVDYLSPYTIRNFLSVENLKVLVLDLPVNFLNSLGEEGKDLHICPTIGALLPTLDTLHIRMRSICSDVLKPPDSDDKLRLSAVVINMSLITSQPEVTSAAHARPCGVLTGGLLQLRADMQEQAEALAARMTSPKTVRVLTHLLPVFETHSFDVLTGKTMKLDDDAAWDEDGETVREYSGPKSEISDDDSSFFDD